MHAKFTIRYPLAPLNEPEPLENQLFSGFQIIYILNSDFLSGFAT